MLKKLKLTNFRNIENMEAVFPFDKSVICFMGDNGQGKTNILEAIRLLSIGKSFRAKNESDLIKWGIDYSKAQGEFEKNDLEVFLGRHPQPTKVYKKNEVKISLKQFVGKQKTVLFHPEDMNMLYLGPDLRRKHLNSSLAQLDTNYIGLLKKFVKLKEHRNALIELIAEKKSSESDLDIWDLQFAEISAKIMLEREKYIDYINLLITDFYSNIAGNKSTVSIKYEKGFSDEYANLVKSNNSKEILLNELKISRKKDIHSKRTNIGPHRDDFSITLNGKNISSHASRGEYRTLELALKMIEIDYINEKSGEKAILLLDDVFSELDEKRRKLLIEKNRNHQIFLTATDKEYLNEINRNADPCVFFVKNGEVVEKAI